MSQGRSLSVPFLLAFLMVMLPLSQVDFSDEIEVDEIVDIRIKESQSNILNLSEPYSVDTFVDQDSTSVPVYWPGGVSPVITQSGSKTDIISFKILDGVGLSGSGLFGVVTGQNFS